MSEHAVVIAGGGLALFPRDLRLVDRVIAATAAAYQ